MISVVIKLQRAYRLIKFRRIVRRSLMDVAWERFLEAQRMIAQRAELTLKKQKTIVEKKEAKKEAAAAAEADAEQAAQEA